MKKNAKPPPIQFILLFRKQTNDDFFFFLLFQKRIEIFCVKTFFFIYFFLPRGWAVGVSEASLENSLRFSKSGVVSFYFKKKKQN